MVRSNAVLQETGTRGMLGPLGVRGVLQGMAPPFLNAAFRVGILETLHSPGCSSTVTTVSFPGVERGGRGGGSS